MENELKSKYDDYKLKRGDIIVMGIVGLPVEHIAIFDGEKIYENRILEQVSYVSVEEFFNQYQWWDIKTIYRHTNNEIELQEIFKRANTLLGKKYHVLKYNCEHFIDDILNTRRRSESLEKTGYLTGGILFGLALGFLLKR